ncbi:MAG: hypothetical protein JSR66_32960 [Proteobacteria bacterium]|nr:hypothetical protein [Pseudomonadota bacterium]
MVDPASLLEVLEDPSLARHVAALDQHTPDPAVLALGLLVVVCFPLPSHTPAPARWQRDPQRAGVLSKLIAEARGLRALLARQRNA